MNAPERTWAQFTDFEEYDVLTPWAVDGSTEYVRADIYATQAARIAELEAALLKSREMLVWSFKEFSDCADADYFDALCDAISVSRKALSTTPSNAMKEKE